MCGLFGWQFLQKPPLGFIDCVAKLCQYNDDQGGDSWGWSDGKSIQKGLGKIFAKTRIQELAEMPFVMGHTRLAALGDVTIPNAHPFSVGRIIGMHNGRLINHRYLNETYQRNCEVGSMHLFYHLSEGRSFEDVVSNGAISFVDRGAPKIVNLARYNRGHLGIARVCFNELSAQGIVWSSQKQDLAKALTLLKNKCEFEVFEAPHNRFLAFSEGRLFGTRQVKIYPWEDGPPPRTKKSETESDWLT